MSTNVLGSVNPRDTLVHLQGIDGETQLILGECINPLTRLEPRNMPPFVGDSKLTRIRKSNNSNSKNKKYKLWLSIRQIPLTMPIP